MVTLSLTWYQLESLPHMYYRIPQSPVQIIKAPTSGSGCRVGLDGFVESRPQIGTPHKNHSKMLVIAGRLTCHPDSLTVWRCLPLSLCKGVSRAVGVFCICRG